MKLTSWLIDNQISDEAFATRIQVSRQAVWRYKAGRVPKPLIMDRIIRVTGGLVLPADFYAVSETQS